MGETESHTPKPRRALGRYPVNPAALGLPVDHPPWWHYVTFNETSTAADADLTEHEKTERYPDRDE